MARLSEAAILPTCFAELPEYCDPIVVIRAVPQAAIASFTELKSVYVALGDIESPY
jgi:hypothetical protein